MSILQNDRQSRHKSQIVKCFGQIKASSRKNQPEAFFLSNDYYRTTQWLKTRLAKEQEGLACFFPLSKPHIYSKSNVLAKNHSFVDMSTIHCENHPHKDIGNSEERRRGEVSRRNLSLGFQKNKRLCTFSRCSVQHRKAKPQFDITQVDCNWAF
jgi:hypothetical protein